MIQITARAAKPDYAGRDLTCQLRDGGEVQLHVRILKTSEIGAWADLANDERAAIAMCVEPEGFDLDTLSDESYQAVARDALNLNLARAMKIHASQLERAERVVTGKIAFLESARAATSRIFEAFQKPEQPATPAEPEQPEAPAKAN